MTQPSSPASLSSPAPLAASKGDVLFVSRQRVTGRTNGSSVYLLDLAQAVRDAGFTPRLVQPSPDVMGRWPVMRLRPEMSVFDSHAIRGVIRLGPWVIARDPRVGFSALRGSLSRMARRFGLRHRWFADRPRPYAIATGWTDEDRVFLAAQARTRADIVIADYAFQAEALRLLPDLPGAIIMHDLFHTRAETDGQGAADSVASLDREREIALLGTANAAIAIQAAEARFVTDHVPGTRAILAPAVGRTVPSVQPGEAASLLFVGSMTAPNVLALEWLFDAVWPRLHAAAPHIRLDVAGTVANAFPAGGPDGVTFHGLVSDLDRFYTRAGIVLSPLTFGSGLKIKLIEALAKGKAMVVTSVTLQGVERQCGPAVALADKAEDFASEILKLQDDIRRTALAEKALKIAQEQFSPQACHAQFVAWLEENRPNSASLTEVAA